MPGLDESRPFRPVNIAVITVSDTRTEETDASGKVLVDRIKAAGHHLASRVIVADDRNMIVRQLRRYVDSPDVDVIISTGGTGVTGRDVTPEAVREVCAKEIPGFGELFRMLSYKTIGVSTIQSRATAGVSDGTYIFALPGSPSACREAWDEILVHQLDIRYRPCNFAELLPRLIE